MIENKPVCWSKQRFVETVSEIVEFFVSNHHSDVQIAGTKTWRPHWYAYLNDYPAKNARKPMSPRQRACWCCASELSYVLACICAQHTTWGDGGVDCDVPFFEMKMWEPMSKAKRQKLAAALYEPKP